MKTLFIIITIILSTTHLSYGQKNKNPKDIAEAIAILQINCPDSLKAIIKITENDKLINLSYPWGGDYETIFKWFETGNKKSKIKKYLIDKGISFNPHQHTVILIAFKKALLGENYEENEILRPYHVIENRWAKEDSVRFTTDSLRGIYIPKDLKDCFKKIDSFWNDSTKATVKQWTEDEFIVKAHFGFGMWMRNNWQLWGGSRLSKYFNNMGIFHPDDMSGIILTSYHRYLIGIDLNLEEQIKYYQDYWKKVNEQDKKK